MIQTNNQGETLNDKIAREFERLRAEGISITGIFAQLYTDLRTLAGQKLRLDSSDMDVIGVVNELYLRIVDLDPSTWESGHHFVRYMV